MWLSQFNDRIGADGVVEDPLWGNGAFEVRSYILREKSFRRTIQVLIARRALARFRGCESGTTLANFVYNTN